MPTASFDLDALREFSRALAPKSRILSLGPVQSDENRYLSSQGFEVQGRDSESTSGYMLLSLPKESFDGAWVHQVLNAVPKELCPRLLGSVFAALKPMAVLFISAEPDTGSLSGLNADEIASLVRQSGFLIYSEGKSLEGKKIGFIARRV